MQYLAGLKLGQLRNILLFGAGKSTTVLIDYLLSEAAKNNWRVTIADASLEQVRSRTGDSSFASAVQADINDAVQRRELIRSAEIVISMMPPAFHAMIATDCVELGRHLLTASYVDDAIKSLEPRIREKNLLFLCEMGLDPGIDHMSAMKLLDGIKASGGKVEAFRSHCGGLVAPENDDNPWHYKISWNPRNVALAGQSGAAYLSGGILKKMGYRELFENCSTVNIDGLGRLAFYPNRDSIGYIPVYGLEGVETFMRTTLRYPSFCTGWSAIVKAGLADPSMPLPSGITYTAWSAPVIPFVNEQNKGLLEWLGLFDHTPLPVNARSSADVLQYLLETRLLMKPSDKDLIVMQHEIGYLSGGRRCRVESSLIVKGEDNLRTAMAKTVGLPLGIAAGMILNGTISLRGLHIPTSKEIYEPVLAALELHGIRFRERWE
jgi:saccharopine dehydrogenase-like NADP-dependent oxidoreductase